jgi:RNA polymerase sigma-70 factor (ECF subfamily)
VTVTTSSSSAERQRAFYDSAVAEFGDALSRLIRSYERDTDKRADLRQEIHFALWQSFGRFDERCSLRTWTYRVAHNVASTFVRRHRRSRSGEWVSLDELETIAVDAAPDEAVERTLMIERLHETIRQLHPPEQQLMLLYLEGLDAASIGEITGLSASNVATKIHRIKKLVARLIHAEAPNDE